MECLRIIALLLLLCSTALGREAVTTSQSFRIISPTEKEELVSDLGHEELHNHDSSLRQLLKEHSHNHSSFGQLPREHDSAPAIWITLAQRGLDYLKDVLLTQILENIAPLPLPDIAKSTFVPFVGEVTASFTNVTLIHAAIPSSTIALGETGIAIQGLDVAANLTLNWEYKYDNFWLPRPVIDRGGADVEVVGMQAGVSVNVLEQGGTLRLDILECGTYIGDLEVQLKGDNSWLYQWLVDGLEEPMRITIEEQLTAQLRDGVENVNAFLLGVPQQVQVDETSAINFTVGAKPIISPTSLSIGVMGKFHGPRAAKTVVRHGPWLPPGLLCKGNLKMVTIALSESVFNDGASIYYDAELLEWLVDQMQDKTYFNTSKWKFLIPQLYLQYPNDKIKLSFQVTEAPVISISLDGVDVSAATRMTVGVATNDTIIDVACITITASAFGFAGINENNITGQVALNDMSLNLEWSSIGKIHMTLVKVFAKTFVKDVLLPYLNLSLRRGFPLPVLPSMVLKDPTVSYGDGYVLVCTDVQYIGKLQKL